MKNHSLSAQRGSVIGQGALLTLGLTSAQLLSFARNAMLGHLLSKGDFGVAAGLTLTLQMLETLSDVAVDRMIVRSPLRRQPPPAGSRPYAFDRARPPRWGALAGHGTASSGLLPCAQRFLGICIHCTCSGHQVIRAP